MATPVSTTSPQAKSRRALLAGALGGLGAWAVGAVGRASPVRGAGDDGTAIVIGATYANAQSQTTLANNANNGRVLWVASNTGAGGGGGTAVTGFSANGVAVEGWSNTNTGVYGHSDQGGDGIRGSSGSGTGVRATSSSGMAVYGSNSAGVPAMFGWNGGNNGAGVAGRSGSGEGEPENTERTGVYGEAQLDPLGRGVWGSASFGRGVVGETQTGVGLFGTASSGFALRTSGRLKADKVSGLATINAGSTSKTIAPGVNVTATSFVLLTPKANIGSRALWFTTNATDNKFTIRMSSSRPTITRVAWLLLG